MNSMGYFTGDCLKCAWAWLNLWSNTDESEALIESHLWGLLSDLVTLHFIKTAAEICLLLSSIIFLEWASEYVDIQQEQLT